MTQCGKMALLDRLLPKLRKRGHKVLIFSQVQLRSTCSAGYLKPTEPCWMAGHSLSQGTLCACFMCRGAHRMHPTQSGDLHRLSICAAAVA